MARSLHGQSLGLAIRGAFGMFGTSRAAPVEACRKAVAAAAWPLGASQVRVGGAGALLRRGQTYSAPIDVAISYPGEVRQARIECRLDAAGRVVGLR
jgi:hypothetical protein